jgi:hypothetical protein
MASQAVSATEPAPLCFISLASNKHVDQQYSSACDPNRPFGRQPILPVICFPAIHAGTTELRLENRGGAYSGLDANWHPGKSHRSGNGGGV